MAHLTETAHEGEFLVSEASGTRSRENITLLQTPTAVPGSVIGQTIADPTVWATVDSGATTGAAGILVSDPGVLAVPPAEVTAVAIVRDAEVNADEVDYGLLAAPDIATAQAALLALGIILRDSV